MNPGQRWVTNRRSEALSAEALAGQASRLHALFARFKVATEPAAPGPVSARSRPVRPYPVAELATASAGRAKA